MMMMMIKIIEDVHYSSFYDIMKSTVITKNDVVVLRLRITQAKNRYFILLCTITYYISTKSVSV